MLVYIGVCSNEAISIMAYVRNIIEDAVVVELIGITIGAPRTYGVKAKYKF
jgi:hypothetical protein